jgi:hypothetical protein
MNSSSAYSAPSTFTSSYTSSTYGSSKTGGVNLWIMLIIGLIFVIMGFVIYKTYLDKGSQISSVSSQFDSFSKYFAGLFGTTAADTTKKITTNSATGTKAGVDVVEGTINKGVNKVEKATGDIVGANAQTSMKGSEQTGGGKTGNNINNNASSNNSSNKTSNNNNNNNNNNSNNNNNNNSNNSNNNSNNNNNNISNNNNNNNSNLNKAVNYQSDQFSHQQSQYNQNKYNQNQQNQNRYHQNEYNKYNNRNRYDDSFHEDEATSCIQSNKSTNKSGWCYIGQDQDFRSCIQVGDNDTCMSGDIFPSQEICVNPSLRV